MTTNLVVLDTNILIYLVSGSLPYDVLPDDKDIICPSIVMIEALGYQHITLAEEKKLRDIILDQCIIAPLDSNIVEQAISIRQNSKTKSPDAIVAATAIVTNAELWTHNTDDYIKIEGLKLHDPLKE